MSAPLNSSFHAHYFQSVSPCLQTGLPCHCQIRVAPSSARLQHRATAKFTERQRAALSLSYNNLSRRRAFGREASIFSQTDNHESCGNTVSAGTAACSLEHIVIRCFWLSESLIQVRKKKKKAVKVNKIICFQKMYEAKCKCSASISPVHTLKHQIMTFPSICWNKHTDEYLPHWPNWHFILRKCAFRQHFFYDDYCVFIQIFM